MFKDSLQKKTSKILTVQNCENTTRGFIRLNLSSFSHTSNNSISLLPLKYSLKELNLPSLFANNETTL